MKKPNAKNFIPMGISKKQTTAEDLLETAKKHQALPIFAEVSTDVVGDDGYTSWFGEITDVRTDELWDGKDHVWSRSDAETDNQYFVEENAPEGLMDEWSKLDDDAYDKATLAWIASLPWVKCIVIYVDTPVDLPDKVSDND